MERDKTDDASNFYLRYYVGQRSEKLGHEFLEFEIRGSDGRLRYANCSKYKSDNTIRKEVFVNRIVVVELMRIIEESKLLANVGAASEWPKPSTEGKQEIEVSFGPDKRFEIEIPKIGSLTEISRSKNSSGLLILHYLILDIKCLVFSLINLHFRVKPV